MKFAKTSLVLALFAGLFGCTLLFQQPTLIVTIPGLPPLDLSYSSVEWRSVEIAPRVDIPVEITNTGRDSVTVDLFVEEAFQPTPGFYQFSVSEESVAVEPEATITVNVRFDPSLPSYTNAGETDTRATIRITDNDDEEFELRMSSTVTLTHQFDFDGTGGLGQFDNPFGIALYGSDVFVADTGNSRVQRFDETGTYEASFGENGSFDDQFDGLSGIAVSVVGWQITGETINARVQRFTPLNIHDSTIGGLGQVYGVAITADAFTDQIIYAIDSAGFVRMLDDGTGASLGTFGSAGSGPGQFDTPYAITLDSDNNVYVADGGGADTIHVFDSAGTYITEFSQATLDDPQGLAVLSTGDVYVTDSANNRIVIFDRDLEYVNEFGGTALDVSTPRGIVIDEDNGNIYVVDSGNNRVRVFRLE